MPTALAEAEEYLYFLTVECQANEYAEQWWNVLLEELRHLIYESHRIIFTITGKTVAVLRIYHASRRPLR